MVRLYQNLVGGIWACRPNTSHQVLVQSDRCDSELIKTFCYDIHVGLHSNPLEDLLLLAHLELCSRSAYVVGVDHGLSLIRMSVSNFSHF